MPEYELIYLKLGGRATPIRLMLTYLGIPFKDTQYDMQAEWPSIKESLPFGQGPVLVIDKTAKLAQTPAILHYLAKEHGLEPEGNLNQAYAEMYANQVQDSLLAVNPWFGAILHKFSEEKIAEAYEIAIPKFRDTFAKHFENQIKKNGSGYLIGDKLSWVDFLAAFFCEIVHRHAKSDILAEFPNLKRHWESILNHPKLVEAVKKERSYVL